MNCCLKKFPRLLIPTVLTTTQDLAPQLLSVLRLPVQARDPHLPNLLPWSMLRFPGKDSGSLLTVAFEAEDTFLKTVQGHKADVFKHVQTGTALGGQVLPLGLAIEVV